MMLVQFLDTLGTIVPFCNHFHLYLRTLYGVSFTNHGTEDTVAAESGVSCHQQVTQIYRIINLSGYGMHCFQEPVHLLYGIGHQYGLEVVSVFQTTTDSCRDGIYILQYRAVFNTGYIFADRGLYEMVGKPFGQIFGFVAAGTSDCKIGETFQGNLLGMARTGQDGNIIFGHPILLMEIFRYDEVLIGYNTLDSRNDELVLELGLQFLQMALQVRRGSDEYQYVRLAYNLVDV